MCNRTTVYERKDVCRRSMLFERLHKMEDVYVQMIYMQLIYEKQRCYVDKDICEGATRMCEEDDGVVWADKGSRCFIMPRGKVDTGK